MEDGICKINEGKCISCGKDVPILEYVGGIVPLICIRCFEDY